MNKDEYKGFFERLSGAKMNFCLIYKLEMMLFSYL